MCTALDPGFTCPLAETAATATVLLPTHNGEAYLGELLDSLLAQDHQGIRILARDDASEDATADILSDYARRYPGVLECLTGDNRAPIGALASFGALMQAACESRPPSEFYLFCDQDDIWHAAKVSRLVESIADCEPGLPALGFCDMRVVDAEGALVDASFLRYQGLVPEASLSRLLVQNHVSGCACLFNRAALELACPLPQEALMHDWWVALLAKAQGQVRFCADALVDYRQHGRNLVGAPGHGMAALLRRGVAGKGTRLARLYTQADALARRLDSSGLGTAAEITGFCQSAQLALPWRSARLLRGGYLRRGWLRNLPLLLGASGR